PQSWLWPRAVRLAARQRRRGRPRRLGAVRLMLGLVGDIGGTNARFALVDYLEETGAPRPDTAVLAVAGPVTNGAMHCTNLHWEVSDARLTSVGGFKSARLLNDFEAQALAAPRLDPAKLQVLGPDLPRPQDGTLVILGPGTGF